MGKEDGNRKRKRKREKDVRQAKLDRVCTSSRPFRSLAVTCLGERDTDLTSLSKTQLDVGVDFSVEARRRESIEQVAITGRWTAVSLAGIYCLMDADTMD